VVVRVVGVLLVLVFVVLALAWVLQRRLIYLPCGAPAPAAEQLLDGGSAVRLHTDDGLDLTAWHAPAAGPTTGVTVLVLPGNAGSRLARVPLARALAGAGFDVLLLDYRGDGGNPGSPTEDGLAADARAAHHHLVGGRGVRADRLVLFGEPRRGRRAAPASDRLPLVLRRPPPRGRRRPAYRFLRSALLGRFRSATPSAVTARRVWSPAPASGPAPRKPGRRRAAARLVEVPDTVTTIPNWATARWSSAGRAGEPLGTRHQGRRQVRQPGEQGLSQRRAGAGRHR
jgi:hypothetical protein